MIRPESIGKSAISLKIRARTLVEVNLATKDEEPRPIFISANLLVQLKQAVLILLREFKDVFAWTYAGMPGFDSWLVTHKLDIKERSN